MTSQQSGASNPHTRNSSFSTEPTYDATRQSTALKRDSRGFLAMTGMSTLILLLIAAVSTPASTRHAEFDDPILLPFVWMDLAAVILLSTLPLAVTVSAVIGERWPSAVRCTVGLVLIAIFFSFCGKQPLTGGSVQTAGLLPAVRSAVPHPAGGSLAWLLMKALSASVGVSLVTSCLLPIGNTVRRPAGWPWVLRQAVLGLVILTFIPAVYTAARCRHDADRFASLQTQSQLGEALHILNRLLTLDLQYQHNGRPLKQEWAPLQEVIGDLSARVTVPLPDSASLDDKRERARELAMLGRVSQAESLLKDPEVTGTDGEGTLLLATILENQRRWTESLHYYEVSRKQWESLPSGAFSQEGLERAWTGIGFCQRRLGMMAEAEQSWQKLLSLSPTADHHFLLAQLYEEAQNSEKAVEHAQLARQLAPTRYGVRSRELLTKVRNLHFGCLRAGRSD